MSSTVIIREGTLSEVYTLSLKLPEFDEPYNVAAMQQRIEGKSHLILVATVAQSPVGFKVGYERGNTFYSWLGGVLPAWRRRGIAQKLAQRQEQWALKQSYQSITLKTRNRHRNMLLFAIRNGFNIIDVMPREKIGEYRILLKKILTQ